MRQMNVIDAEMTLAEVVNAHPSLARELERRGLDYCCGGARSLGLASTARGLDPAVVAEELSAAVGVGDAAPDWSTMSVTELVDHVEATHHRYLWDEMPRLSALVDKIVSVHGSRHPELGEVSRCYAQIRADLEPHMLKEERVLFPLIRELAASSMAASSTAVESHCGSVRNPISVMLAEHDLVGTLLEELSGLTDGYQPPPDGCATYQACYAGLAELEADTHLHIHKENNVLFPAAIRLEQALGATIS